jgi:hypothetical protein
MQRLRCLAACECSGLVRDAFAARDWEAWSADLLPSETPVFSEITADDFRLDPKARGGHYQGDVRDLFDSRHPVNYGRAQEWCRAYADEWALWDLVIAFPPCTHLSLAGAVWWKDKRKPRYDENFNEIWSVQDEAAAFFMEMANAPAPHVAVENPRGDMTRRWRKPDQYVQPWMFGDPLTKLTGLWLKNLPLLTADNVVEPDPAARVATGGGSWRTDQAHGRGANNGHEDSEGRKNRQAVRNRTLPGFARAMADQWGDFIEQEKGPYDD